MSGVASDRSEKDTDLESPRAERSTEPSSTQFTDGYRIDGQRGWRQYRWLQPGRGMYHDVKRRLPYYWSDITDAFTYRTFAATIRMYFVNLLPALAYLLDMYRRTGEFYGVNEALFASALAAIVFSLLGAQPITIVGITGLISLWNYTTYDILEMQGAVDIYPEFMAWQGIWAAIFHWIAAVFNTCDYMRYVTDFSSESFGLYVAIIYIIKGVEELVYEFDSADVEAGYLGIVIGLLFFASVFAIEKVGKGKWFTPRIRGFIGDYSLLFGTLFWSGFSHIPGRLYRTPQSYVPFTRSFYPTQDRSWIVDFWNLEVKWVFVSMPFGFLLMLLFYYDHNVSSITAQARHFPLKKPGGFHWDFFLLGCVTFISAVLGLPFPNGLVPQAPVHTDSLTVYETTYKTLTLNPTHPSTDPAHSHDAANATTQANKPKNIGDDSDRPIVEEIRIPVVTPVKVIEQRMTHFLMALMLIGTMTRPLLVVLHTIPNTLFGGVFLIVGIQSLLSNGILAKLKYLLTERRFIAAQEPLLQLSKRKIWGWIGIQIVTVLACVAVSQTVAAIGFPVLIIALIPVRVVLCPRWFSREEMGVLDALTADSEVVLASLGGAPKGFGGKMD